MKQGRDYGAILADATEINGRHARTTRQNNLNEFRQEVEGWFQYIVTRGQGPSRKEAQRIVEVLSELLAKVPDIETD